jgi:hypothetical protein
MFMGIFLCALGEKALVIATEEDLKNEPWKGSPTLFIVLRGGFSFPQLH